LKRKSQFGEISELIPVLTRKNMENEVKKPFDKGDQIKETIKKRNKTRKVNQLIDKFNLETDENKRLRILEKI